MHGSLHIARHQLLQVIYGCFQELHHLFRLGLLGRLSDYPVSIMLFSNTLLSPFILHYFKHAFSML